jgi:hypothetical protein
MATMPNSLQAWGSDDFKQVLQKEMETFRRDVLPLDQVIDHGNRVYDNDLGVTVMRVSDDENAIYAKVGVFFAEVISCVSCGEGDPIDEAYCEMQVTIDKRSAEATFQVVEG